MIVYIDENLPPQLAKGLHILQEPLNSKEKEPIQILSIKDKFGQGAKDEEWIPLAGEEGAIIITQDYRIQTTRHQSQLYREHGLGIFFFTAPSKGGYLYWEIVEQVIKRWSELKNLAFKTARPFAYRCTSRS